MCVQVSYAEPLVAGACGAASNTTESRAQAELLQHARTVLETLTLLVHAARTAAGNPRVTNTSHHHPLTLTVSHLCRLIQT